MLTLHTGGQLVTRDEIERVETPEPTQTHYPVPHGLLLDTVKNTLITGGYACTKEQHALSKEGQRYFGVLQLHRDSENFGDRAMCVGIRNSHDKTFSAELVLGNKVFVCDNLSFIGQVKLSRKHTRFIFNDLASLASRAVGGLLTGARQQNLRIEAYKNTPIDDKDAGHLLRLAMSSGQPRPKVEVKAADYIDEVTGRRKKPKTSAYAAITSQRALDVWSQWEAPVHAEFEPRNVWSLFNAFTEVYKQEHFESVRRRSQTLHGVFDTFIGLAA